MVEVGVVVIVGEELGVGAGFGDAAIVQVDDVVRFGDGEEIVGNDDGGAAGHEAAQGGEEAAGGAIAASCDDRAIRDG
jgi:hypothetical protein